MWAGGKCYLGCLSADSLCKLFPVAEPLFLTNSKLNSLLSAEINNTPSGSKPSRHVTVLPVLQTRPGCHPYKVPSSLSTLFPGPASCSQAWSSAFVNRNPSYLNCSFLAAPRVVPVLHRSFREASEDLAPSTFLPPPHHPSLLTVLAP